MGTVQAPTRPARTHGPLSPCCSSVLIGTAILWCGQCGHTVPAADIDHEYHPKAVTQR